MLIVGAGLSGLIAANLLPDARIIEAAPERSHGHHRALLRFRGPEVGNAVGIDFRPVTVYKGVWDSHQQAFVNATIQLANEYSQKCIGQLGDRSIWKTEPVTRWIAPEDLYQQLIARASSRIQWGTNMEEAISKELDNHEPVICTAPLNATAQAMGMPIPSRIEFRSAQIAVKRWRVSNADVFQTVYFPRMNTNLYRASITGDLLIAESAGPEVTHEDAEEVASAFCLHPDMMQLIDHGTQRFGKIAPINDGWRRMAIHQLSVQHRIFSLGRFATWRNILLDDVLKDITVIKKLINSDIYTQARHAAGS